MEYKNIGLWCKCGGQAFEGDFVRQPRLDDELTCVACKTTKTAEDWRRATLRRIASKARELTKRMG